MPQIQLHPFKKSDCSNSWYLVLIRDGWSCFRDSQDEAADQHLSSCRNAPTGISHHLSTTVLSVCPLVYMSVCISTVVRLIIAMMMMVPTENSPEIFFLFQLETKSYPILPPLSPSHLYLSFLPLSLSHLSISSMPLSPSLSHLCVSSLTLSLFSRSLLFHPCGKCD